MTETYLIDGEQVPIEQVDEHEGDLLLSTVVAKAVGDGFDFGNIWRHKEVTVKNADETMTATVVSCSIEHGMAAVRLTDIDKESRDTTDDSPWYVALSERLRALFGHLSFKNISK